MTLKLIQELIEFVKTR